MLRPAECVLLVTLCLLAASCATPRGKIAEEKPVDEINNQRGLALGGYDPVAYFTEHKPVQGKPDISYQWHGATYRFASTDDRDRFQGDPEHFAPQFGGYCAYAVSLGTTADGDPLQWTVDGDRLFVNNNALAAALWSQSRRENIEKGIVNWPLIRKQPVAAAVPSEMAHASN